MSDKIGRRPMVVTGALGYVVLFGALFFCKSIWLANALSFIGGAATSLYDGGVNPGVMEIYPNDKSTASVINKGAISVSGVLYPLLVGFVLSHELSPNILLIIPLVISILVFLGLLFVPLPDDDIRKEQGVSAAEAIKILEKDQAANSTMIHKITKANRWFEGLLFPILGFCIYSTFYLFQQVVSIYATDVLNLGAQGASQMASIYQVGSFLAVILSTVIIAKGIRDISLMVVFPLLASAGAMLVYLMPTNITLMVTAFVIGFCAAGGILQMGNSLFNQFFDTNKGRNTNIYFFIMSLGSYVMPRLASYLKTIDFTKVMLLDAGVAFLAFLLMILIAMRYKKVFGVSPFSRTK